LQISAERTSYLCIRRPYDPNMFSLQLVALFFVWRGRSPDAGDLDRSTRAQPARSRFMSGLLSSMKASVDRTYPLACEGSSTACNDCTVEPSPNSTNVRCFWFRTVRTDPTTVTICWSWVGGVAKTAATLGLDLRSGDEWKHRVAALQDLIACLICSRDMPDERHIMAVCPIELRA